MWDLLHSLKEERRSLSDVLNTRNWEENLYLAREKLFQSTVFWGLISDVCQLCSFKSSPILPFNISFGAEQMRICTICFWYKSWNRLKSVSCSCKELGLALETVNMKSDWQMVTCMWPRLRKSKLAFCGECHCWCGALWRWRMFSSYECIYWISHRTKKKKKKSFLFSDYIK